MLKCNGLALVAVALACANSPAAEANRLNETRETLTKWVETRQLLSRTKAEWQADKETLEQSVKLFQRELQAVEEQSSKLTTNSTQVDKERAQAEALKKSSSESLDQARQFASEFEAQLARLVPQLPLPLQEILKPFLSRIPADPVNARVSVAERIQVIVGALNELDKFNNSVAVFSEKRRNQQGDEIAVETVYVGLGAAYFVNAGDDFAGTGVPGRSGWDWTLKPELASAVREVIRIYRNERPARFVALPASVR
jgi:septal ring factor EnvC (AmiA/AmiB activator)